MMMRGQIQLRGILGWKVRRAMARRRYGGQALDKMPVVFGNAIPKNGSKLLFNILRGLTDLGPFVDTGLNEIKPYFRGKLTSSRWILKQFEMLKPGDIRLGYLYNTEENISAICHHGWANFLIIRDPRDAIVSEVFYALDINPQHLLHDYLLSLGSMEARVQALISGIPEGDLKRVDIRGHYERFLVWLEHEEIFVIRFEDLITGPRVVLGRILDHLEVFDFEPELSRVDALEILQSRMAPDKSETFRKGKAGDWRNHFTVDNKNHFKEIAGDLLIQLGYEATNDW